MTSTPTTEIHPPRGAFSVWHRLLRGYGPLAVGAVMLFLMAVLVPSKVPDRVVAADGDVAAPAVGATAQRSGTSDSPVVGGSTPGIAGAGSNTTGPVAGTAAGRDATVTAAAGSSAATSPAAPAAASGCADRADQIPGDEYSPPCVSWGGGSNGGATHKGVTDSSVRVSFRVLDEQGFQQTMAELAGASLTDTPETVRNTVEAMADYFSRNFEFYGRSIDIVFYDGKGSNTSELLGGGRDKAEADAITVAEELGTFADLSATSEPYADALADRGIIGFGTPYLSRGWHEERAPFAWSLATDGTRVSELAAEYSVNRLYGKPAAFVGGDLNGLPRKFAGLAPENSWYQESVENSRRIVTEAGFDPGENIKYVLDIGTMSNQAANIVPKLKSLGVTTLICGCDPVLPVFLTAAFARERYYPEFIVTGTALTDADIVGQLWDEGFMRDGQALGVSSLEPFQPPQNTIAYAAFKSVRPDEEPAFSVDLIYYQMYMLAIGLQGAGPNLTPQTFEAGMFAYPQKSGTIGLWKFGPGDRTAANDVREIYWDPDAISPYNARAGSYLGTSKARWEAGSIPSGDPGVPR